MIQIMKERKIGEIYYLPLANVEYEGHANQVIPLSICEIFWGECCRRPFALWGDFCSFEGFEQLSQLLAPLQPYLVRIKFHPLTCFPCLNVSIVIPFPPSQHPVRNQKLNTTPKPTASQAIIQEMQQQIQNFKLPFSQPYTIDEKTWIGYNCLFIYLLSRINITQSTQEKDASYPEAQPWQAQPWQILYVLEKAKY